MKTHLLIVFLFVAFIRINAQNYAVAAIPEDLKTDAQAVIREYSETFVQDDAQTGIDNVIYTTTIFDEKGDNYMNFHVYEDFFRELKNFSGEIFNAQGKSIKKIGKKDLVSTAISDNLADNGRNTFYIFHAPSYPITVKYVYELKYKNGILAYPPFFPVFGFRVSVEKADYTLQIPQDVELREKKLNTQIETVRSTTDKSKIYKWSINQFKALPYEAYAPVEELFPVIYLSPEKFCMGKTCGDMSDWEHFESVPSPCQWFSAVKRFVLSTVPLARVRNVPNRTCLHKFCPYRIFQVKDKLLETVLRQVHKLRMAKP